LHLLFNFFERIVDITMVKLPKKPNKLIISIIIAPGRIFFVIVISSSFVKFILRSENSL
jgi:hypothetical protein